MPTVLHDMIVDWEAAFILDPGQILGSQGVSQSVCMVFGKPSAGTCSSPCIWYTIENSTFSDCCFPSQPGEATMQTIKYGIRRIVSVIYPGAYESSTNTTS